MHTISKEFHFSASHILKGLPKNHPCGRMHGHNYVLTVYLTGKVDEIGFVIDYRKLQPIKDFVDHALDHRHLNDVFDFNPTVENMAEKIYWMFKEQFPELSAVALSETSKTRCYYEPDIKSR
jgi:6-pyruvoyltetrahydropterin/6-carboxytetrahydropterin synthase